MSKVTSLFPPISQPKVRRADVDGGLIVNIGGILQMARDNDTVPCRFLTREYAKEYRVLEGSPLTAAEREQRAFRSAWDRMHKELGTDQIAWPD